MNQLESIIKELYGIEGVASKLYGEIDQNFILDSNGEKYLLKSSPDGTEESYIHFQESIMRHLGNSSLSFEIPRPIPGLNSEYIQHITVDGEARMVRLQSWIKGKLMANCNPIRKSTLYDIGKHLGKVTKVLQSFNSDYKNSQIVWAPSEIDPNSINLEHFPPELQGVVEFHLSEYDLLNSTLKELRKSWIYHDANDHNLILGLNDDHEYSITGIIDFGDVVFSHTINDLAVAIAYAVMNKINPLEYAKKLVAGYNTSFPLQGNELEVLYNLVALRLIISLNFSGKSLEKDPGNQYLQVSRAPAIDLLTKWSEINPNFAYYSFRESCGLEPIPDGNELVRELSEMNCSFPFDSELKAKKFDLSVGSKDLGLSRNYLDLGKFNSTIDTMYDHNSEYGYGGYLENRAFYTTDSYIENSDEGPQWRTTHLGVDFWLPAGTIVHSPLDGVIHGFNNNEGNRNYGPTIILEHSTKSGRKYYSLYGHLATASLAALEKGQVIKKGDGFCALGNIEENGGWPPHLHFQLMIDLMGEIHDFPGVCYHHELNVWRSICPDPDLLFNLDNSEKGKSSDKILQIRKKHLPPNLSLSYKNSLHIVRGHKQFLFSYDGRRYLDTVNNVAHVGHEHPKVVEAGARQMAVLNTNTRYLHEEVAHLSEKLAALFPDPLEVCFFVNSGSEATELAVRLAKTYTAKKGMVVMDVGYHGNTNTSIEVSSYKFDRKGGKGPEKHIKKAPLPDSYRGIYQGANTGPRYAEHVKANVEELHNSKYGFAAFICESILSCGGQVVLPDQFLNESIPAVKESGGLVIMDEVQVGFGRVGTKFWGFEMYDIIPDIVTMGKPFGNGHPLGAVITTREIADAFANGMEYFNTFGGNPVSSAIGNAVIDIIKEEGLQSNALERGNQIKSGLKKLQEVYPVIGDVRGEGLFLGFELMEDPGDLVPSKAKASYLANRMVEKGVLMSTDGFDENVIKIKPPMCITKDDIELLLALLEEVLKEDFMQV